MENSLKREFSPPAHQLRWLEGSQPVSEVFSDRFFSQAGGLAETEWVFLRGNGLPERWKDHKRFVIAELGFGTGLNFLVTWKRWLETAPEESALHYISFERYPLAAAEMRQALSLWPELRELQERFLARAPLRLNGFYRVHFDRLTLTLIYGDARDTLPELRASIDAWFLDGFAPARNPELWQPDLFSNMKKLSAPEATLATYSVARQVVEGLRQAGFAVEKQAGFGSKREMLSGCLEGKCETPRVASAACPRMIVIGGGLSGTATARSFARRNWQVTLFERETGLAKHASGNPGGILMPHLSAEPDYLTRVSSSAFAFVLHELAELSSRGVLSSWKQCGVLRLATSSRLKNLSEVFPALNIGKEIGESLNPAEILSRFGLSVPMPGIFFPQGGWLHPAELCKANLHAAEEVIVRLNTSIYCLQKVGSTWQALNSAGELVAEADAVVLCGGSEVSQFREAQWLPLEKVRGQVLTLASQAGTKELSIVLCYDGYITPSEHGAQMVGATFDHGNESVEVDVEQNIELLRRLARVHASFDISAAQTLDARVAFRAMSRDRLPIVGELPDLQLFEAEYRANRLQRLPAKGRLSGLYVNTGFGSRGILWSHFCAEHLACIANQEPLPLEQELVEALDPARFPARLIRQGRVPSIEELEKLKVPLARDRSARE